MQSRAEQQIAALAAAIQATIQDEQAARQKRHSFTLEAVSDMGMTRSGIFVMPLLKNSN